MECFVQGEDHILSIYIYLLTVIIARTSKISCGISEAMRPLYLVVLGVGSPLHSDGLKYSSSLGMSVFCNVVLPLAARNSSGARSHDEKLQVLQSFMTVGLYYQFCLLGKLK